VSRIPREFPKFGMAKFGLTVSVTGKQTDGRTDGETDTIIAYHCFTTLRNQ